MEEVSEKGKESLHSAHVNGITGITIILVFTFIIYIYIFIYFEWI
jgi:hypothetical protein